MLVTNVAVGGDVGSGLIERAPPAPDLVTPRGQSRVGSPARISRGEVISLRSGRPGHCGARERPAEVGSCRSPPPIEVNWRSRPASWVATSQQTSGPCRAAEQKRLRRNRWPDALGWAF